MSVLCHKVPYGTTRFCWLKDQINREDDTLRIGQVAQHKRATTRYY